jgi:hypothetical protein
VMNATTSMAVAKARIADDRRWTKQARQQPHPATCAALQRAGRWSGRLGAFATVLAGCALFASIPTMAGVSVAPDGQPRPMPAPAPLAVADFPEHARVDAACTAILTRSAAVDNARSERAVEITSAQLADACFGA